MKNLITLSMLLSQLAGFPVAQASDTVLAEELEFLTGEWRLTQESIESSKAYPVRCSFGGWGDASRDVKFRVRLADVPENSDFFAPNSLNVLVERDWGRNGEAVWYKAFERAPFNFNDGDWDQSNEFGVVHESKYFPIEKKITHHVWGGTQSLQLIDMKGEEILEYRYIVEGDEFQRLCRFERFNK